MNKNALKIFLIFLLFFTRTVSSPAEVRETPHFVLRYHPTEQTVADILFPKMEELRSPIIRDLGVNFADKTTIFLASSDQEFQELQPHGARLPSWSVGVAYPRLNLIILKSPLMLRGQQLNLLEVFQHEFSHIALGRVIGDEQSPLWLWEGFALYHARQWTLSHTATITRGVLGRSLFSLNQLERAFPRGEREAALAYAQSFSFVSYLLNKYGREVFQHFTQNLAQGIEVERALEEATGASLKSLEADWIRYLKLRHTWFPILTSSFSLWFLITLIFLAGYIRKRIRAKAKLAEWEEEEGLWH
ncbi:MAG: hypothetical protein JSU92_10780 [Deltaproteobacteria bacterium]|nr:MAG: hypothetical protein JSU92_10780 [Deltaproteobacteria bacterium]